MSDYKFFKIASFVNDWYCCYRIGGGSQGISLIPMPTCDPEEVGHEQIVHVFNASMKKYIITIFQNVNK